VPSQQLQGQLQTQHTVVTREYWRQIIITSKQMTYDVTKYNINNKIIIKIIIILIIENISIVTVLIVIIKLVTIIIIIIIIHSMHK
jgi:hypothetical protein